MSIPTKCAKLVDEKNNQLFVVLVFVISS